MSSSKRHVVVLAAIALVAAACASGTGESKAGGAAPPISLKIGTNDPQGRPGSNQIEEFARRVSELSAGAIRIEPVWNAAGDGPDWDQRVARMVTEGGLDMALIPSRAWDTEGVTSLRALNAPFLITSDELAAEVVSSGLADEMLAGLEEIGVVGLALFPEGLRHPFGFEAALLGPDDYAGGRVRAPTSEVTKALFEALGATVTDERPNEATQTGMESSYALEPSGVATGNVTFYPKVNSLVIAANTFERLTSDQQNILERAAAETTQWAIDTVLTDEAAAGRFCESGHSIVLATEPELAALREATRPVYEWLEEDGQTKELISRISQLKENLAISTANPATCGPPVQQPATASRVLDGVYRFEITKDQLRESGVTDPGEVNNNYGVFTMTLSGGDWCIDLKSQLQEDHDCGSYTIDGNLITLNGLWDGLPPLVFEWTKASNGDLRLAVSDVPEYVVPVLTAYVINPWIKIGEVEAAD